MLKAKMKRKGEDSLTFAFYVKELDRIGRACLDNGIVRRQECPEAGASVGTALFALPLLLKSTENLEHINYIPASGFSPNQFVNDSSIVSLVHNGEAQLSTVQLTVSFQRWGLINYTRSLMTEPVSLVYRLLPPQAVSLDLNLLFPARLTLVGLFVLSFVLSTRLIVSQSSLHENYEYSSKLGSRIHLFLLTRIFAELINSHLTGAFTRAVPPFIPIKRDGDFLRLLKSGAYTPLYRSKFIIELLKSFGITKGRFLAANEDYVDVFDKLDKEEHRLLYISGPAGIKPFKERMCDIRVYNDESFSAQRYLSVGYNPSIGHLLRRLTEAEAIWIEREWLRLSAKDLKTARNCRRTEVTTRVSISMPQMQTFLVIECGAVGLALLSFLLEVMIGSSLSQNVGLFHTNIRLPFAFVLSIASFA